MTSHRTTIETWMSSAVAGSGDLSAAALAEAAQSFFSRDGEFIETFLEQSLRAMFRDCALSAIGKTRHVRPAMQPRIPANPAAIKAHAKAVTKMLTFKEFIPSAKLHRNLMDLTRTELLEAAATRKTSAHTSLVYSNLWETLAGQMTETDKVSDRFTADELANILSSLSGESEPTP